jgi:hypothetical protein
MDKQIATSLEDAEIWVAKVQKLCAKQMKEKGLLVFVESKESAN